MKNGAFQLYRIDSSLESVRCCARKAAMVAFCALVAATSGLPRTSAIESSHCL